MARTPKKTKTATAPVADQTETSSAPANVEAAAIPTSGTEVFIPLDKLKKSPRNARKTPHREAEIEAYAASIAAKGIRRDLTKTNVPATDRRAIFIGAEDYTEAGGAIIRDLFTEDRGGFYEDAALLDQLVIEKLEGIAQSVMPAAPSPNGWRISIRRGRTPRLAIKPRRPSPEPSPQPAIRLLNPRLRA